MSTPRSWSGGGRRQADEVGWGQKVMEMGWGTDKDEKGKKGGCTMTLDLECVPTGSGSGVLLIVCTGACIICAGACVLILGSGDGCILTHLQGSTQMLQMSLIER